MVGLLLAANTKRFMQMAEKEGLNLTYYRRAPCMLSLGIIFYNNTITFVLQNRKVALSLRCKSDKLLTRHCLH